MSDRRRSAIRRGWMARDRHTHTVPVFSLIHALGARGLTLCGRSLASVVLAGERIATSSYASVTCPECEKARAA